MFYKTSGATAPILDPFTSNLPIEGTRSTTQATGFAYPGFMTADQIEEWFYRFKTFSFSLSYELSGVDGGDTWLVQCAQAGTIISTVEPFDEEVLYTRWTTGTSQWTGAQGGFDTLTGAAGVTGSQTVTINGTPNINPLMSFTGAVQVGATKTQTGVDSVPYYYRTDTGLWLPQVDLTGSEAGSAQFNLRASTAVALTPGAGEKEETIVGGATINGMSCNISTILFTFLNWDSFSLTITPASWWEYRDRNGVNPIWNSGTGAKQLPNTLPMGS